MARVRYGTMVTQISGSISGNTFAAGANGFYVKRRTKNKITRSQPQLQRRNQFKNIVGTWRTIGNTNQTAWKAAAVNFPYQNSLNITSYYTGFQLFSKFSNQLIANNQTVVLTAPTPVSFTTVRWYTCEGIIGFDTIAITIYFGSGTSTTVPSGFICQIWATPNVSFGVTAPKASLFKLLLHANSGVNIDGVNIYDEYFGVFGQQPTNAAAVYFRARLVSTTNGQVGAYVQTILTTVTP